VERRLVGQKRSRAVAHTCNEEMYSEILVADSSHSWCYIYIAFEHSELPSESDREFDVAGIAELQLPVVAVGFLQYPPPQAGLAQEVSEEHWEKCGSQSGVDATNKIKERPDVTRLPENTGNSTVPKAARGIPALSYQPGIVAVATVKEKKRLETYFGAGVCGARADH